MPHFNIACDDCRILYRAHVYGFRAPRVKACPVCGKPQRGRQWKTVARLEAEGYRWVRLEWDTDARAWQVVDDEGNVIPRRVQAQPPQPQKPKQRQRPVSNPSSWDEIPAWLLE